MTPAATTAAPLTGLRRLEMVVLLGALTAFAPLSIDMYLPALPTLQRYFQTSEGEVQLTLASFFLGFALGQTLYGPIADRFGRKPPLYAGMLLYSLASLSCARAFSVRALTAFRLLQALGACSGSVMSRAMVRDLFPVEETRRVYSALILVMGVSPLAAPLLGSYILLWFGWKAIFLTVAGAGLLALIGLHFRVPETLPSAQPLSFRYILATYRALLGDGFFVGSSLATGFSSAGMFAYIAGSPFVFIDIYGMRPDRFAWLFGVNAAAVVIGAQINGRVLHGHAPERVMRNAALVQSAAGVALIGAALTGMGGWLGLAAPLFVFMSTIGFVFPNAVTIALANHGRIAGMASALLGMLQFSMAAFCVLILGAINGKTAVPMSVAICACGLLGVASHVALIKDGYAPPPGS
ncbi:MAG TPA: Bcr/CflA family multidrug efflux MFS transporter [Bryobacteraceae bacterium]|jgi:DHA1 family bicyclomycin/chloramphenicol resistance-like MFS transporter